MFLYLLYSAATSAAAKNIPEESYRCLEGRRYKIMPINDTLTATETEECCDGYKLIDDNCREAVSVFHLDPVMVSRFVVAMGLIIISCGVIAIVSMIIAYKMFYQRKGKADQSERITLAEDLDSTSDFTQ